MARLSRIRYVNVGPPRARLNDVSLELVDETERATDSIILLRNGGGKTTLLSLLFSVLRPDRKDFLGAKQEGGEPPKLEDHILPGDRGAVILEWELDPPPGKITQETALYLTGAFYEYAPSVGSEGSKLRKLFFAGRAHGHDPALTLEGIPLYGRDPGTGRKTRRNMKAFRDEWAALAKRYPHLEVITEETHERWARALDKAGIDTELFHYLVRMNHREGGAEALFKFNDSEQFLDFLLDLLVDPASGDAIVENIQKFREGIRERNEQFIPEAELNQGVLARLAPLALTHERRRNALFQVGSLRQELDELQAWIERRVATLRASAVSHAEAHAGFARHASELQAEEERYRRLARNLEILSLEYAKEQAEALAAQAHDEMNAAKRELRTWEAAEPLALALFHEEAAERIQRELDNKLAGLAPIHDRLVIAARAYADVLTHHVRLAKRDLDKLQERQRGETAEEGRRNDAAAVARERANFAESDIQKAQQSLQATAQARADLLESGALHQNESGPAALARMSEEGTSISGEIVAAEKRQQALIDSMKGLDGDIAAQSELFATATAEIGTEKRLLERATIARRELEKNNTLARLLESPAVDIERATADVAVLLDDQHRAATDEAVRIHVETASEKRALQHLRDYESLPALPQAERLVSLLKSKLNGVATGWQAIAELLPENERPALVESRPDIALGIVVRDEDLARARELVTAEALPDIPLVLSTQSEVIARHATRGVVVGPATRAHYDVSAARVELGTRERAFAQSEERIKRAESLRAEIERLRAAYHEFRRQYPVGWFASQATTVQNLQIALDAQKEQLAALRNQRLQLERDHKRAGDERAALIKKSELLDRHRSAVERFIARHESHEPSQRTIIASKEQEKLAALASASEESSLAAAARQRASELMPAVLAAAQRASTLEGDLQRIDYLEGHTPAPSAGQLSQAKAEYDQLKLDYESAAKDETLLREKRQAKLNAERARAELADHVARGASVEEAQAALSTLDDRDQVKPRRAAASDKHASAAARNARMAQLRDTAVEAHRQARDSASLAGELEDLQGESRPPGREQADVAAAEARRLQEDRRLRAGAARLSAEMSKQAAEDAERKAADLVRERKGIAHLQEGASEILSLSPSAATEWQAPADDAAVPARIEEAAVTQRRIKQEMAKLDTARTREVGELKRWIQDARFNALKGALASKLSVLSEDQLESNVQHWTEQLTLRQQVLQLAIERMDTHREAIATEMLNAAEESLRGVHAADTHSRLPDHIAGLGGEKFLRITTHEPSDRAARLERIKLLLDDIVKTNSAPNGVELTRRSVRDLARPTQVKILFPDDALGVTHVDVGVIGKTSGGERLTAAVLLYCTLANLRAKRRGKFRRPTSVCILDNPFGTVSRRKFVDLQREVAKANNVQLVFTTHLMDLDALSVFPRIVRLRNSRIDANTNHRLVELISKDPTSELAVAHLGRKEAKTDEGPSDG